MYDASSQGQTILDRAYDALSGEGPVYQEMDQLVVEELVGVPIKMVSVGAGREETILMRHSFF